MTTPLSCICALSLLSSASATPSPSPFPSQHTRAVADDIGKLVDALRKDLEGMEGMEGMQGMQGMKSMEAVQTIETLEADDPRLLAVAGLGQKLKELIGSSSTGATPSS